MIILEDEYNNERPITKWGKRIAYGLGGAAALLGANAILPGGVTGTIENSAHAASNGIANGWEFAKRLGNQYIRNYNNPSQMNQVTI